jgi:hypothetical protein
MAQRITCKPLFGQVELDCGKGKNWHAGDTREVTDAVAAQLLDNVNFVKAGQERNPFFTCSLCGQFTNDGGAVDHVKRTRICASDQQKLRDEAREAARKVAAPVAAIPVPGLNPQPEPGATSVSSGGTV